MHNKVIIHNIVPCMLAALLLAGCTSHKPGAYERVDEDRAVNTVQYRYDPEKVDKNAMYQDITRYCAVRGFDKVEPLNPRQSVIPGLMKVWYQCNYSIKS